MACDIATQVARSASLVPGTDAEALLNALQDNGEIARAERAVAEAKDPLQLRRRLHDGFDAFGSLKLIHALRDTRYPSPVMREAIADAAFAPCDGREELETIRSRLEAAERV